MAPRIRSLDDAHTDLAEIASALGVTKQAAQKRSATWSYCEAPHPGNPRRLYALSEIPHDVVVAVLRHRNTHHAEPSASSSDTLPPTPTHQATGEYDSDALWNSWQCLSKKQKERSREKLAVILAAITAHEQHGMPLTNAIESAARDSRWSYATMRDIYYSKPGLRDYARKDWLAALATRYKGRRPAESIDDAAFDFFKADYLRLGEPKANPCFRRLQIAAKANGWRIPADPRPILRRIEREVNRCLIVLMRQGADALARSFPPQRRDVSHLRALQAVNADGHTFDVFVKWPDGDIKRPVVTAWQDVRSGKVLSWRVDRTESADSYRLSLADLLREYGIPSDVYVDNGRGIASKRLTGGTPNRYRFKVREGDPIGLLTQLVGPTGIHWTTPYHGQAKPIEREFRNWCEDIAKDPRFHGAYTGNTPMAKPENYGSHAVPLDDFIRVLDLGIREANARRGRRGLNMHGRSHDEVFQESYERHAHQIPRPAESQLAQWLLCAERIVANKVTGEVSLFNGLVRYWGESLSVLIDRSRKNREVLVYFDPDHLDRPVYVHAMDGRLIGRAEFKRDSAFDSVEDAREHISAQKKFLKGVKMQRDATVRMKPKDIGASLDASQANKEPQGPTEQRVVRGAFGRPTRRAVGHDIDDPEGAAIAADESLARAMAPLLTAFRADSLVVDDDDV